jgi:hypothetical protein
MEKDKKQQEKLPNHIKGRKKRKKDNFIARL